MNGEQFNEVVEEQLRWCKSVLDRKGMEYAGSNDRLHNFKIAAQLEGCEPRRALSGMMAKHVVSVFDMCSTGVYYSEDMWEEKIGDTINYLLLLKGLLVESSEMNREGKCIAAPMDI